VAVTYLLGIDIESVRAALGDFKVGQGLTPGRCRAF
jgi:hypothetical protein